MDDEIKSLVRVVLVQILVLVLHELVNVVKRWIAAHNCGDEVKG